MKPFLLSLAVLASCSLGAQVPSSQKPLTATSTLVLVPALVHDKAGEPVYMLSASDFLLTDNGQPQALRVEDDAGNEPLAVVIDLEVGGAGTREYDKLGALIPMLEALVGGVQHRVAVVGFDSEPTLVQPFTAKIDSAKDAILSLQPGCTRQNHFSNCEGPDPVHDASLGDNGAAILDSVAFSVSLLRAQPARYRRVILLISETADRGSKVTLDDAVRAISDTNTSIYSIGFSTAKSEAAHYAHQQLPTGPGTPAQAADESRTMPPGGVELFDRANHIPNPPTGCMGKIPEQQLTDDPDQNLGRLSRLYDCMGQLMPPLLVARVAAIAASNGLKRNAPETVARLTGGEYFKLTNAKSLERSLSVITNHLPNRYMLSFQPVSPQAGLHHLSVKLIDRPGLIVQARTTYWSDDGNAEAK
ncbi:VWA domain-containing protein [Granulicella sibirica]|uniref:VWFA domain-containing protein n=1 Tax=Granulicella sibirica TaxID=2479048 RepID=A0A4Q0T618_9BACT|nr:VWA domain-containing protein [Granulicella sibirica]RXH57469.1 hypothetical protein GRAN_0779 [Granulicella sibirica]